jgi:hypothetical protein
MIMIHDIRINRRTQSPSHNSQISSMEENGVFQKAALDVNADCSRPNTATQSRRGARTALPLGVQTEHVRLVNFARSRDLVRSAGLVQNVGDLLRAQPAQQA